MTIKYIPVLQGAVHVTGGSVTATATNQALKISHSVLAVVLGAIHKLRRNIEQPTVI